MDIPLDYRFVDWDHLYKFVGRAVMGENVPMMSDEVAKYLEEQSRNLHRVADRLTTAAQVIRAARAKG